MRLLLTIIGCYLTLATHAQAVSQRVYIQFDYEKLGQHLQEATETIEAVNKISKANSVEYRAGKTVLLLPGFEARTSSVFVANVRPVSANAERTLEVSAFPNPFEQITTISYYLPASGKITLKIMDSQGRTIHHLINNQEQTAGKHELEWHAGSISSGVYFPIIENNQQRATGRIIKK